jgi:hypothetical protein
MRLTERVTGDPCNLDFAWWTDKLTGGAVGILQLDVRETFTHRKEKNADE